MIEQIEQMAAIMFSKLEIATVLNITISELNKGEMAQAYDRGKLTAEATFRKGLIKLANQGSGPAQTLVRKLQKDEEVKRAFYE